MDWKSVISKLAPTVASVLGGPMAGIAVSALGEMFGIAEPTQEKIKAAIESGQMTGEQISAIKQLEMTLKAEEAERGFRYAELEFKDRNGARNREVQTGDKTPRNLTYIIVIAFLVMVACTLAGLTQVDSVLAGTLIGYLSAKCEQALAYFLGSTSGSQDKNKLLAGMSQKADR